MPAEQATDFHIRPVFHQPEYAGGGFYAAPMPNYNVTSTKTDWASIAATVLGVVALLLVGSLFASSFGCHDQACYDSVKAIGVARANAAAGVPTDIVDGNVTACTGKCWETKKVIGVANANARAGFGNNTGTEDVNAVKPDRVIAAPAPLPVVVPQPVPLATGCCGNRVAGAVAAPTCRPGFHSVPPPQGHKMWCAPDKVSLRD